MMNTELIASLMAWLVDFNETIMVIHNSMTITTLDGPISNLKL
jgi:hypothetical protein